MLEKIKTVSEAHLAVLISIVTAILLYGAYTYGDANLQEMSNRGLKLSAFMVYAVSLFKCLGTFKLDIIKEIAEEQNIALGIVVGALLLGGAACILL